MKKADVCPWQAGNLLASSARKLIHNPHRILAPYITEGMTVMDVGCGMGYFTIPIAQMVKENGKVAAIDIQREMLEGMLMKAKKTGLENCIEPCLSGENGLNIGDLYGTIQFAILFMMLHEVPNRKHLVQEVSDALAQDGKILFAEPVFHVGKSSFEQSLQVFRKAGLTVKETPRIAFCRAVLLEKVSMPDEKS